MINNKIPENIDASDILFAGKSLGSFLVVLLTLSLELPGIVLVLLATAMAVLGTYYSSIIKVAIGQLRTHDFLSKIVLGYFIFGIIIAFFVAGISVWIFGASIIFMIFFGFATFLYCGPFDSETWSFGTSKNGTE